MAVACVIDRRRRARLDAAAVDGETSAALDQGGGARAMVRRALHAHRLRADHRAQVGRFRRILRGGLVCRFAEPFQGFVQLLLDQQILRPKRESPLVDRFGRQRQIKIFLEKKTEAVKQRGVLRRLGQLDEVLFLADAQRYRLHIGRGQRLAAAGGALLYLRVLVGLFRFLLFLVPDGFDPGQDHLQRLQRFDRFLVEAEDEELSPMSHFGRIAFDLAENILGCLRGEIHRLRRNN